MVAAYGVTHLLSGGTEMSGGGLRVLLPRELAYDRRDGQWRGGRTSRRATAGWR